jgi:tripartite-type tricarboxylate transporter receptor subunit TctC
MGRVISSELAESENWRIIVENKPGAIQTIGLAEVLKQPADGYTIASIALPASAAPALLPNLGFRLDMDFAPVIKLASAYHVLVVHPAVPAKSLGEFVALLKDQPDKYTRIYWWCRPPKIGTGSTRPTVWAARAIGASLCSDKCVRASL